MKVIIVWLEYNKKDGVICECLASLLLYFGDCTCTLEHHVSGIFSDGSYTNHHSLLSNMKFFLARPPRLKFIFQVVKTQTAAYSIMLSAFNPYRYAMIYEFQIVWKHFKTFYLCK